MRVIAGTLGGRQFDAPRGHATHPMSDKARGALFNALGDISSLTVLDAFSGSGAIGLEAVSRGAATVLSIEQDRQAQASITSNITTLKVGRAMKLIKANINSWSELNPDRQFDLIIADPPYDKLQAATLEKLVDHLAPNGVYVLSWPGKQDLPELYGLQQVSHKSYGDMQLAFYKHKD